ncbi:MAG: hypothetical protein ACOCY7_01885 [Halodesulfurarchaeum sp.]
MGFERYEKRTGAASNEPRISIRESETIGINTAAMRAYFEGADGVICYYDDETNQVGLEPADADDSDAYTIQVSDPSETGSLSASGFLNTYRLVPEKTTRYEATWDEDHDMVIIDLDAPIA